MMRRTIALLITPALGLLVARLTAAAQLPGKVAHLGILSSSRPLSEAER